MRTCTGSAGSSGEWTGTAPTCEGTLPIYVSIQTFIYRITVSICPLLECSAVASLKPGSQYDAGACVESQASKTLE